MRLPVVPGTLKQTIGLEPKFSTIHEGIPAVLDDSISFYWLPSNLDRLWIIWNCIYASEYLFSILYLIGKKNSCSDIMYVDFLSDAQIFRIKFLSEETFAQFKIQNHLIAWASL